MAETWANSGLDLHLDVSGPGMRAGLERSLREAVQTGRLAVGTRLPSSRVLARDLGVARNTVAEAYGQLVAEGWLAARQGSGTEVADRVVPPPSAVRPVSITPPPIRYDLRPGSPDVSAFPRTAWLSAARRALSRAPNEAFGYGDPRGRPELRLALARYLARARGVRTDPESIMICSGFTQGLGLLGSALVARHRPRLAVESYGLPVVARIADACGLQTELLPTDAEGAVVSAFTGPGTVLLSPAHQFPLGVALSADRRRRAVAHVQRSASLIIEDDYDGEFRYDRQPIAAVQALDPDSVVYLGTASKSLAPALRLAWMVVPPDLLAEVVAAKEVADRQSAALDQLTLAELIDSGGYDRQVRRMRLVYRRRRDHLIAQLHRSCPGLAVAGVAAGLQALIRLPDGVTESEATEAAGRRGLAVEGLVSYRLIPGGGHSGGHGGGHSGAAAGQAHPPALVVGFANPPDHAFGGAVAALMETLTGLL